MENSSRIYEAYPEGTLHRALCVYRAMFIKFGINSPHHALWGTKRGRADRSNNFSDTFQRACDTTNGM